MTTESVPREGPQPYYVARRDALHAEARRLARRGALVSNLRLAVFAGFVALCFLVFGPTRLPGWTLLPPLLVFAVLVVLHDREIRGRRRAERAVAYFESGLARLEQRFPDDVEGGERFVDPDHLYAVDLDLFGPASLFAWLCRARTPMGQAKLAAWLLAPAAPGEIRARQAAVEALARRPELRERLCLVGEEVAPRLHEDALRAWAAAPAKAPGRAERATAALLALVSATALAGWAALGAGPLPWVGVALLAMGFAWTRRTRVRALAQDLERVGRDLDCLSELLACLEAERFEIGRLAELRRAVETQGLPPSRQIARLRRLRDLFDARRNQFFAPLGALLLFTTQVGFALEAWRASCAPRLPGWLDAVAELEALASLATQAFEHPADVFPEIVEEGPRLEAEGLGHPLLDEASCVPNDVCLSDERRLLVVSGSNMSGKSTLLRSVGVNAVLAQAGASVRARRLRVSPLVVGASLQVHDSLLEGASRFYAEITRLQRIVAACEGDTPVLFLLDEILHGTNSHDRRIGAEAVVRALVARGALGLVTTHDLALAAIADHLAPRAANVHFEDRIEAGRVRFDYRLRPGVVEHSNALALMRAVGLEV